MAGVAYHHAGLTLQERGAVESGYRRGLLLVLCATSTLAAGINLPARRVILRSLKQGIGPVAKAQYLQMVGRAGRAGGWLLWRAKCLCVAPLCCVWIGLLCGERASKLVKIPSGTRHTPTLCDLRNPVHAACSACVCL